MKVKGDAAAYLRRSKDPKERGRNVAWQKRETAAIAKAFANEVVPDNMFFADNDKSASKFAKQTRTDWARLLQLIEHGNVRRLYCVMLDRLTRQPKEAEKLVTFADAGLFDLIIYPNVRYEEDPENNEPFAYIDLRTTEGINQWRGAINGADVEIRNLSARLRRSARRLRAEGRADHGTIAVGFLGRRHGLDSDSGEVINEVEAARMRTDAERWLNGTTLTTIAQEWSGHVKGLPMVERAMVAHKNWKDGTSIKQTDWTPGQVRGALLNPRNAGLRTYQGDVIGQLPQAIYSQKLWRALELYAEDVARGPRGTKVGHWSSWVVCAGTMEDGSPCGATMLYDNSSNVGQFRCKAIQGRRACGRNNANAAVVQAASYKWLATEANNPALRQLLAGDDKAKKAALATLAKIEERRAMLDRKLGRGWKESHYDRAMAEVDRDEAEAQTALRLAGGGAGGGLVEQYLGKGDALVAALTNTERPMTAGEHRALLLGTKHRAYILPSPVRNQKFTADRVKIRTRMPTQPKQKAA
jgi:resolvase-like protein